jgi:hypothetical protein
LVVRTSDFGTRVFNARELNQAVPQLIVSYTAPPSKITIPFQDIPVTLDKRCDIGNGEYPRSPAYSFVDFFGELGSVYLKHDKTFLYVCVIGISGQLNNRTFTVYLDKDNGKEDLAEADDYALDVKINGSVMSSHVGDGAGGYTPSPIGGWSGVAAVELAEYRIPLDKLDARCGDPHFGLAVYHWEKRGGAASASEYGFPTNNAFNSPKTWVDVALAGLPACSTPPPSTLPEFFAVPYLKAVDPILVAEPLLKPNLSAHGIELTQGIQCFNTAQGLATCPDNSLALANKKDTTARIYLKASGLFSSWNNVPVRLHIFANGVEYIANTSGNAKSTINQLTNDDARVYFNVNFNNDIAVSFYAEVDPNNVIAESNESDNRYPASGTINLTFRKRDTLKIVGWRLRYHPSGYAGSQYAGGWAVNGGAADWFEQMLPIRNNGINYSIRSGYLDWTKSLGSGDGQHDLIKYLNTSWMLNNTFSFLFGTNDLTGADHLYGWAPNDGYSGGHADMPIYPHAGGLGVVGIGTDRTSDGSNNTDAPGGGTLIMGHELVHDYNLMHTDTGGDDCGSDDGNSDFPYATSSIQEVGFNPLTAKIYDPSTTHDLMSYCPAGGSKQGWVSPFTWNRMSTKLDAVLASSQAQRMKATGVKQTNKFNGTVAGQSIVVNVTIFNPTTSPPAPAALGNMYILDGGVEYLPSGSGYTVEIQDASNNVLYTAPFTVSFASEYASHTGDEPPFPATPATQADVQMTLPWLAGSNKVVVKQGATTLTSKTISANAPTVNITNPTSPVSWPAGLTQTVSWTGSDADGDPLSYSVFYSKDGGLTWDLLIEGLTQTSYNVQVDAFAGSTNGRFKVLATDGMRTGMAESASVTIPNKPPLVGISNPISGTVISPGGLLVMQGAATDLEDGHIADGHLNWSSDIQGALGSGPSVPTNTLQVGWHNITLSVTDSDGATTTHTTRVLIGQKIFTPIVTKQ